MPAVFIYLLKVIVCSGTLYGYYRVALYNRSIHQWNRCYLLVTAVVSPLIPLMQWKVLPAPDVAGHRSGPFVQAIIKEGNFMEDQQVGISHSFLSENIIAIIYLAIVMVMLAGVIVALLRLLKLIRHNGCTKMKGHWLVMTNDRNAPFSFFRCIFWNVNIDLRSDTGNVILQHELVHVRQWHSLDKLIVNLTTILFWCNPFFWLVRKELDVVHEFIADNKTICHGDHPALSRVILMAAYPSRRFSVTSNFYSSSIKRRLNMFSKSFKRKNNLFSLLCSLPVLFILLAAFTFTHKQGAAAHSHHSAKPITVVIDAAHGGTDNGAVSGDGTREKDLALAIAKKIQQENTDPDIHIILSRSTDVYQELRDKVNFTVNAHPDAFISIHVNSMEDGRRGGFELYSSKEKPAFAAKVNNLETLISRQLTGVYPSMPVTLKIRSGGRHIFVLDAPEVNYPALVIECGNILNADDVSVISDPVKQQLLARQLLKALGGFAAEK